jgi:hypothetical protein
MAEAKSKDENVELAQKEIMNEQVDADKHLLGMIQKACQYVSLLPRPAPPPSLTPAYLLVQTRTTKAARALDYAAQLNFPKSLAIAVQLAERSSLTVRTACVSQSPDVSGLTNRVCRVRCVSCVSCVCALRSWPAAWTRC